LSSIAGRIGSATQRTEDNMNTKSAFGAAPLSPRRTTTRALIGTLLAAIGAALAPPALADRDPFPAWQQKQFAGRTAQPET